MGFNSGFKGLTYKTYVTLRSLVFRLQTPSDRLSKTILVLDVVACFPEFTQPLSSVSSVE